MDRRLDAIFARRSVRRFTGAAVEPADLTALLEAGMAAPSARNLQPWRFVVVTGRERLDRLAAIRPYAQMLGSAGACIAVAGDRDVNPDFWVQDCAAAMLGLGAVWLGVHPRPDREDALKELLGLPGPSAPAAGPEARGKRKGRLLLPEDSRRRSAGAFGPGSRAGGPGEEKKAASPSGGLPAQKRRGLWPAVPGRGRPAESPPARTQYEPGKVRRERWA